MEDKKVERTQAKKRVTRAINKLKSSLLYLKIDEQKQLASNLEEEFEQLVEINEDCIELGVRDDYMADIQESFHSCMRSFHTSLRAEEEINTKKLIEIALVDVQPWFERMGRILGKSPEDGKTPLSELLEMQEGMVSCEKNLKDSRNKMDSLSESTENEAIRAKMEDALAKTTMFCLDLRVLIKEYDEERGAQGGTGSRRASIVLESRLSPNAPAFRSDTVICDAVDSYNVSSQARPGVVRTKLPTLPTFSGDRADWPEFRCVWASLAEAQYTNKVQLAMELKRSCKGKAAERVRHIYVTHDKAYEDIWARLREEYDDPGLCSQEAINRLMSLRRIEDQDYPGMVDMIDIIDGIYCQLNELNQLSAIHAVDVDRVSSNLPGTTRMEWLRKYRDLSDAEKLSPFKAFVKFLRGERAAIARLSESFPTKRSTRFKPEKFRSDKASTHVGQGTDQSKPKNNASCVVHGNGHLTADCRNFKGMTVSQRYDALRKDKRCFKCFEQHPRDKCPKRDCECGKSHHKLLCTRKPESEIEVDPQTGKKKVGINLASAVAVALYPICKASIKGSSKPVTVLLDGGSNASYVTSCCAQKHKLKQLDKVTLNVTTVGGKDKEYKSAIYEANLRSHEGRVTKVTMYELPKITEKVSLLNQQVVENLFPQYDSKVLMRDTDHVDMLIGTDYFGLHPKEELAKAGENLSIMRGQLGVCLVGTHPLLKESTQIKGEVPRTLHLSEHRTSSFHASLRGEHPAFSMSENFIVGEELGTECNPRCGACKCGKCPIPGHDLSFREEQELHVIRSNLSHDPSRKAWTTSYPWVKDPETLPDNYISALGTLKSTERSLMKDPGWAESYQSQIVDMVDRGVARKLTQQEIEEWKYPFFYISHLAVSNVKSKSTPVRIVFNSAQVYKGVSLNSFLAKGPDSYRNSVLSILLRWREEAVPLVGDIRKMFHSVHINPLEQHCHRFLWRDLDTSRDPDVYVILRVTMGDKPAPAIATEALFMTAEMHKDIYPRACQFILESSYVDDLIDSVTSMQCAEELAKDTEEVLAKGGFHVKCWQSTGTSETLQGGELKESADGCVGVLGVSWNPVDDTITYVVNLNFSKKKRGERTEPNLKRDSLPDSLPSILTRRLVLQQVMGIYDPMGLVSPFTLLAKILLRETWQLGLDWDDPLPPHLYKQWVKFFVEMFQLEDLKFPRCLKPSNYLEDPWLILLSDGSKTAYGCAAYIRWRLTDGNVRVILIMSKSRIAPLHKVSIPRMELNGAVLSKRMRVCITKEMRYNFKRIIHLVDSETVLHSINNTSCRFKVYEGVRLGEIQSATDVSEWAWIPGEKNIADWLTRGKGVQELRPDSIWYNGPPMFYLPFEQWDIKFIDDLVSKGNEHETASFAIKSNTSETLLKYENISTRMKAIRVVARLISMRRNISFRGGHWSNITPKLVSEAELMLIKEAQQNVDMESDRYKTLNPAQRHDGVWVVGASRLAIVNPLSTGIHSSLPVFLPSGPLAHLCMKAAHERAHRGRDSTLASFRERFWTPSGPKLAKSVVTRCQTCKLRNPSLMKQEMGGLPLERSTPSPPFNFTMLDLFGPYQVRGEVQKRTSGKAWGALFVDMVSRAVHVEVTFGFDTDTFLLALRRFVAIRGWPQKLYSDPGSQLVSASIELKSAITKSGSENGMEWIVGTADAPWHQGAVESLVKTIKRAIHLSTHNQRLSVSEFLTVCTEAANIVNERPLGLLPDIDSEINILTPNCMLLGRASSVNPNVWSTDDQVRLRSRSHLVSSIMEQFWKHWTTLFAPSLLYRRKWHERHRDLKVGDVVLVLQDASFKDKYRLARVTEVWPSKDGRVRKVTVAYKNYRTGEKVNVYKGASFTSVFRSCQKLVLLVPIDE